MNTVSLGCVGTEMIDPAYEAQWADLNTMNRLQGADEYCVPVVFSIGGSGFMTGADPKVDEGQAA